MAAAPAQAAAGAWAADVQAEAAWPAGRPVIYVSGQAEQGMHTRTMATKPGGTWAMKRSKRPSFFPSTDGHILIRQECRGVQT